MPLYIYRQTFFREATNLPLALEKAVKDIAPQLGAEGVDLENGSDIPDDLLTQQGFRFESICDVVQDRCKGYIDPEPITALFLYAVDVVEPDGLERFVPDAKVLAKYKPLTRRDLRGFAEVANGVIYPFFKQDVVVQRGTSDVLFGLENL